MKVTVCFGDTKVIVPCGGGSFDDTNVKLKVADVIESSIAKYKKAAGKTNNCVINVLKLQTVRDGGILDPDDFIQDVVEDKELLAALYQEFYTNSSSSTTSMPEPTLSSLTTASNNNTTTPVGANSNTNANQLNSLNNSSMSSASTSTTSSATTNLNKPDEPFTHHHLNQRHVTINSSDYIDHFDDDDDEDINNVEYEQAKELLFGVCVATTTSSSNDEYSTGLKVKSGSESCIYKSPFGDTPHRTAANNNNSSTTKQSQHLPQQHQQQTSKMFLQQHHQQVKSPVQIIDHHRNPDYISPHRNQPQQQQTTTFSRVNANRQSMLNNEHLYWSSSNSVTPYSYSTNSKQNQSEMLHVSLRGGPTYGSMPLGIHVIPTFDSDTSRRMGLVIQRIEPNGRVDRDGRLRAGDRIIEINGTSLIGVDFMHAQEILREAIRQSSMSSGNQQLDMKLVRLVNLDSVMPTDNGGEGASEERNEDEEETKENKENNENTTTGSRLPESTSTSSQQTNLSALNTKKIGKRVTIELVKGAQGLGFKLAARDNCAPGEFSPIYIKNILPKGAAITDGRLQRGDRLLEVDDMDMTQRTLHEAVNILRNTKLGATVKLVISRQVIEPTTTTNTNVSLQDQQHKSQLNGHNSNHLEVELHEMQPPTTTDQNTIELNGEEREIRDENDVEEKRHHEEDEEEEIKEEPTKKKKQGSIRKQLLTFEIPLNETGSAGLGVSVKGKTKRLDDDETSVDLGIFIKTVINGGAASKDGRLRPNDQLININGFSLLGKSNEEAMIILREAMMVESKPGHIELTVSRKFRPGTQTIVTNVANVANVENTAVTTRPSVVKIIENELPPSSSRFNRDAPARRSMSEKRTKIGNVPPQFVQSLTSSSINKYGRQINGAGINKSNTTTNYEQNNVFEKQPQRTVTTISTNDYMRIQPINPNQNPNPNTNMTMKMNQPVKQVIESELLSDKFSRIGSFESVINRHQNVSNQQQPTQQQQQIANKQTESKPPQAPPTLSNYTTLPRRTTVNVASQPSQQQHQQHQAQANTNPIYSNPCRRSASMESIPSTQPSQQQQQRFVISVNHTNPQSQPQPQHYENDHAYTSSNRGHMINVYNKYGTVSGNSGAYLSAINGSSVMNGTGSNSISASSSRTNHIRPSLLIQQQQQQHQPIQMQHTEEQMATNTNSSTNNNLVVASCSNTSTATTSSSSASSSGGGGDAGAQLNSRLRAVNRSFRTAVDKSFDLPNQQQNQQQQQNNNSSDETSTNKATNNEQTTETTTSKSSKSHKGLIGKFQNLFKSSNPSLSGHKDGSKKHEKLEKQERQQQQEKPAETTNEADLVAKSVEIVNYQKKTLDTFNNNETINVVKNVQLSLSSQQNVINNLVK